MGARHRTLQFTLGLALCVAAQGCPWGREAACRRARQELLEQRARMGQQLEAAQREGRSLPIPFSEAIPIVPDEATFARACNALSLEAARCASPSYWESHRTQCAPFAGQTAALSRH